MSSEASPDLKLSVVIPVYNEQETIGDVIDKIRGLDLGSIEKEIIVSDDGSTDGSAEIIAEYSRDFPKLVTVHTSPINLGKGAAVRLGMACATGDIIIIIQDADLELDPSEYASIIAPIVAGRCDGVYGSRFLAESKGIPLRTRLANRFLTALTNLLFGARLSDMETAYKAFRREVVEGLCLRCVRFDFEPEITARLLLAGHHIHEVPIGYTPRTKDEGKKISLIDGIEAIHTLFRCRFLGS
jgi:glycosyltransferase involved in cell wall biosynthesis